MNKEKWRPFFGGAEKGENLNFVEGLKWNFLMEHKR